ncbi:MAG: hypothetical protein V1838_05080 [Patescibacteria group bacterium]
MSDQIIKRSRYQDTKKLLIVILVFVLLSVMWFYSALSVGFLADDWGFLEYVSGLGTGGEAISTLLTTSIGGDSFYRPVVDSSFWIDYQIYGDNAIGFHLTNVILFGLIVGLSSILIGKLLKRRMLGIIAGLLLMVSPFAHESVIWIAGRTDLLSALFMILSVLLFIKYRQRPSVRRLILFCLVTLLALFSKENSIVLLALLPVIDLFYHKIWRQREELRRNGQSAQSLLYSYYILILSVIVYLAARFAVLGHILYQSNELGYSNFLYPGWHDLYLFAFNFIKRIIQPDGLSWYGISSTVFYGIYWVGLIIGIGLMIYQLIKKAWLFWRQIILALLITFILALPLLGFVNNVTPEHLNARFLFIPTIGLVMLIAICYAGLKGRTVRWLGKIGLIIIFILWTMSSWYGQQPYQQARDRLVVIIEEAGEVIVPAVSMSSRVSMGILVRDLPRDRHGVYITPQNFGYVLQKNFITLKYSHAQMYGNLAITDSILCSVRDGQYRPSNWFSFRWADTTFKETPLAKRFNKRETEEIKILSDQVIENDDLVNFPTLISNEEKVSWIYNGEPFSPINYDHIKIPVTDNSTLKDDNAQLRIYYYASAEKRDAYVISVPITQADLVTEEISIELCQYPRIYDSVPISTLELEWYNFQESSIMVEAPRFE